VNLVADTDRHRAASRHPTRFERRDEPVIPFQVRTEDEVPRAAFPCPGHPLPSAVLDLVLERNRDLLRRGVGLLDERDTDLRPCVLSFLEHRIQMPASPRVATGVLSPSACCA